ncbi:unnamed protein product, partial [Polarella glacialis]
VVQCFRSAAAASQVETLSDRLGLVCQKGQKKTPNQDSAFYLEFLDSDGDKIWLACVMDGHGPLGHEMSALVMQWLPLLVLREPKLASEAGRIVPSDPQTVFDAITAAFQRMAVLMMRASAAPLQRELSGTTCVFALAARGLLHTANVGDSRAVLGTLMPGPSELALRVDCRPLTRDHKPEDVEERARIEAMGGVVKNQRVYTDTWPIVGLNLSRSFGDSRVHAVGVSDVPDVTTSFLESAAQTGDAQAACESDASPLKQFLTVASDGVWEFLSSSDATDTVGAMLLSQKTASQAAERLASRAENSWRQEGADMDDITTIVVVI